MHPQNDLVPKYSQMLAHILGHGEMASFITNAMKDPSNCFQRVLLALDLVACMASAAPVDLEHCGSLKRKVIALRDEYNADLPVSRLPPELLSEIFLIHRARVVKYDLLAEDLSWIRVTRVCRYWRAVGLSCAVLWSSVTFANRASVEAMLGRSSTSPLSLHFIDQGRHRRYTAFVDILPKALSQVHRHRLRSLKLHDIDSRVLQSVICFCAKGVPLLEDISLVCNRNSVWPITDVDSLRSAAPVLKFLHLSRCRISWNDLPMSTLLVRLTLVAPSDNSCRPSTGSFIYSMRELPCLVTLVLDGYLPLDAYPPEPEPILTMSRLCTIGLTDSAEYIANFLRAVSICNPETVNIGLKNPRLDREGEDIHHIIRLLRGSWNLLNKICTPSRRLLPASGITISEDPGHASYEITMDSDPTRLQRWAGEGTTLSVSVETTTPCLSRLLSSLINEVEFTDLRCISIYGIESSGWDEDIWSTLFMHANRVTAIALSGSFITIAILGMLLPMTGMYHDPLKLLPFVSTIRLCDADLQNLGCHGVPNCPLLEVLLKRHRISELCVEDCLNFGRSHADMLEWEFPLVVDWDGHADFASPDGEDSESDDSETDGSDEDESDEDESNEDESDEDESGEDESDEDEPDEDA